MNNLTIPELAQKNHIEAINRLISTAVRLANKQHPEGIHRKAPINDRDAWNRAYLMEMDRLAIAKGLRVP